MFVIGRAALPAVTDEETPVGVQQVVGRSTAKRLGCRRDAALRRLRFPRCVPTGVSSTAMITSSSANSSRYCTYREPRGNPAPRSTRSSSVPSPTTVSSSSRSFMIDGCTGPLKVRKLRPGLNPHAQHRPAAAQQLVRECPGGNRPAAGDRELVRLRQRALQPAQLRDRGSASLISRSSVAAIRLLYTPSRQITTRSFGRAGLRALSPRTRRHARTNDVHREAFAAQTLEIRDIRAPASRTL